MIDNEITPKKSGVVVNKVQKNYNAAVTGHAKATNAMSGKMGHPMGMPMSTIRGYGKGGKAPGKI